MNVLSLSGSLTSWLGIQEYDFHDASAALIVDNEVVFAVEQERLDRVKHSPCTPLNAIKECLDYCNLDIGKIDVIVYCFDEKTISKTSYVESWKPHKDLVRYKSAVEIISDMIEKNFGAFDRAKVRTVNHHKAHAASALFHSGYPCDDSTLVGVFDGAGDEESVSIFLGSNLEKPIRTYPVCSSIGLAYMCGCKVVGYSLFDEYKVMGLAPYGDKGYFREEFKNCFKLLPNGFYALFKDLIEPTFCPLLGPIRGAELGQKAKDFAAGLQDMIEQIMFHVLRYFASETRAVNLCLAGGVAHNCSFNGKIRTSGLFQKVWVHPAAHDAGAGIGAGLYHSFLESNIIPGRISHVFWGKDVPSCVVVKKILDDWQDMLSFDYLGDACLLKVGFLLSEGKIFGRISGRSEYGPRALGHRSILADPRPASNKDRVNEVVKKREGYRPFAPAVLAEKVQDWFDVAGEELPFMVFVVDVKAEKREALGAVTHVDGTARVQTVSKRIDPLFWSLINEFESQTGVPILLNTSFNNNVEPIVDSLEDAITCFLTTGLDHLVVGDQFIVSKKTSSIPKKYFVRLSGTSEVIFPASHQADTQEPFIKRRHYGPCFYLADPHKKILISREFALLICSKSGWFQICELSHIEKIEDLLFHLWCERLIVISPTTGANK